MHTPAVQVVPAQQSALVVHAEPATRHGGAVQLPLTHDPGAQQSAPVEHAPPLGAQGARHAPPRHT